MGVTVTQALVVLVSLVVLAAIMAGIGALNDHSGLFQLGADAFKTLIGAAVGALTALLPRRTT